MDLRSGGLIALSPPTGLCSLRGSVARTCDGGLASVSGWTRSIPAPSMAGQPDTGFRKHARLVQEDSLHG